MQSYRNQSITCWANKLTGFYMRATLALHRLSNFLWQGVCRKTTSWGETINHPLHTSVLNKLYGNLTRNLKWAWESLLLFIIKSIPLHHTRSCLMFPRHCHYVFFKAFEIFLQHLFYLQCCKKNSSILSHRLKMPL